MAVSLAAPAQTRYHYDALGRLVLAVAPDGSSIRYSYDATGNITSITRNAVNALSLRDFTPRGGPAGTTVTLFGSGFSTTAADNAVRFNGVAATATAATSTELTVSVPSGAATGKITVSNARGNVASVNDFVVGDGLPAPTITGFAPQMGTMGTVITVTGANFQLSAADNKAAIGGFSTQVIQDSTTPTPTQLKLNVPSAGASGKISIATPFGEVTSPDDFYALPSNVNPADVAFTARLAVDGPAVTVVTAAAGKKAVLVFDAQAGQSLHLLTSASTFAGSLTAAVYRQDGTNFETLTLNNNGLADFRQPLGADGTYTVVLSPAPSDKGSLQLRLVADGPVGTMEVGGRATVTLGAGRNARYKFTAEANRSYGLAILGLGFTPTGGSLTAYLRRSDGAQLSSCTFTASSTCEFQSPLFATSGDYLLDFDPAGLYAAAFDASLVQNIEGVLNPGDTTAVNLSAGRKARYAFQAEVGKGYGLALTGLTFAPTGGSMTAYLRRPDGSQATSCTFSGSSSCDLPAQYITSSGTYVLELVPAGTYAASFNAFLSKDGEGTLNIDADQPTIVTIAREGQNARYTFNGSAGQMVTMVLSGNILDDGNTSSVNFTWVSLHKPSSPFNNQVVFTTISTTTAGLVLDATLPETGTYSVWVAPSGLDKGSINVHVKTVLTGELTLDSLKPVNLSVGRKARYTFQAEAGKGYGLALTGLATAPTGGSVAAYVRRPDGSVTVSCSFGSNGSCDLGAQYFTSSGTYVLELVPASTYAASFNALLSKDKEGSLAIDEPAVTVTIPSEGANAKYTFSGTAGQLVTLVFSGNALDDGNTATTNPTWLALTKPSSPAANPVTTAQLSTGTAGASLGATLPETGIYTIVLAPVGLDKGTINVQVKSVLTGELAVDTLTPVNLSAGRRARYTFQAEAGKGYGLALTGLAFVPTTGGSIAANVIRPDGTSAGSCTFSVNNSCDLGAQNVTSSGSYALELIPAGIYAATFNVLLSKDKEGSLTIDGPAATVTIPNEGANAKYAFSGTAGQLVTLVFSGNTLDDGNASSVNLTWLALTKPSSPAANPVATGQIASGTASLSLNATLPETGTYTIVLAPVGLDKGTINVQVKSR